MRKKTKKKPEVSIKTRLNLLGDLEEGTTIINCHYKIPDEKRKEGWVNINEDTYLINEKMLKKSFLSLIHSINIPVSPGRLYFRDCGEELYFTLVFERIPYHWKSFCFEEWLEKRIGFQVKGIRKNETGVYHLRLG